MLYSNRRELKQRIGRRVRKDHDSSAYPISPRPFLVTRDGIALARQEGSDVVVETGSGRYRFAYAVRAAAPAR